MSCFDKIRLGVAARLSQSIRGSVLADDQGAARRTGATQERSRCGGAEDVGKRVPEEREKGGDIELGAGSGAVGSCVSQNTSGAHVAPGDLHIAFTLRFRVHPMTVEWL
jgi:hypothetical protein